MTPFQFIFQFDEPTSRLYHLNIISSLLLIFWVALATKSSLSWKQICKKWIFRKKYWWNYSTRQDYFIYLFNGFFKTILLVPLLDCSFYIAHHILKGLMWMTQSHDTLNWHSQTLPMGLFTLFAFIWDDFLRFVHHWLMHKVPFLWQLHKVHHSAKVLTPFTLYRAHPLESIIAMLRNSLSLGISSGAFIFLFGSTMSLWTILGVNGFGFIFNLIGANLRHSHIRMGFGKFEKILISPLQHQIHHSTQKSHYDKNFGVTLSVWDSLFGSLVTSKNVGSLRFGVDGPRGRSLLTPLFSPFTKSKSSPNHLNTEA